MMTAKQVGEQIVKRYLEGKSVEAVEALYADDVISVEAHQGGGPPQLVRGKSAVVEKAKWWRDNNIIHHANLKGPFPHGDHKFAIFYVLDLTNKDMNNTRVSLEEVGVYEVKDGKVTREEFYYNIA